MARPDRGRRLQRAGPGRRADLAPGRDPARLRPVPAAGGHLVQPGLHRPGAAVQRDRDPAAGHAVRVPVRPGPEARAVRAERGHRRGDQRRARRGGQPGPGPDPAGGLGADPRHAADQLLPGRAGARRGPALLRGQAGPGRGARPARAPAAVRAVRLLAPVRGRAPAVRARRAGRAALVRAAGGLPHRGPRAGQGAGGEELGHRAVRGQGRLRVQAAARLTATATRSAPRF